MEEKKIVGRIRPQKNHQLFEYDNLTKKIVKIEMSKEVFAKKDCIYVSAMNLKNAVKKLIKYHGLKVTVK